MPYIIVLVIWFAVGLAGWRVFSKAGFKGAWGLLFLVPIVNFFILLYLANTEWPSLQKK